MMNESPAPRTTQDGQALPWLTLQGSRNYEPFLSALWRQQDRLFEAIRTGRLPVNVHPATVRTN